MEPQREGATDGAAHGVRVLLVEDDPANQEIEALMLEGLGCQVDRVSDGAAALTAAAADAYDAIVMDCQLPVMDGYETTAAIRAAEPAHSHIRIIGLSVHTDVQRCYAAGMDELLAKPVTLAGLADALQHVHRSEAPAAGDILDPTIVEQLRSLAQAGSPELLHRLQASFARDTPERLRALRDAVQVGDTDAIAFNVHTLKGSSANLGAREVVAICVQIEEMATDAAAGSLEPLLAELERSAGRAEAELLRLAESG